MVGRVGRDASVFAVIASWPDTRNAIGSERQFTPVPEPGAALSMVAALATVGVIRRWRRKESQGTA